MNILKQNGIDMEEKVLILGGLFSSDSQEKNWEVIFFPPW